SSTTWMTRKNELNMKDVLQSDFSNVLSIPVQETFMARNTGINVDNSEQTGLPVESLDPALSLILTNRWTPRPKNKTVQCSKCGKWYSRITEEWTISQDELDFGQLFPPNTSTDLFDLDQQMFVNTMQAAKSSGSVPNLPLRTRRTDHKTVRCSKCGKWYSSNGNLMRHIKYECGKEPQFQCPHCPLRTRHKSSLLSHMYCKHPSVKVESRSHGDFFKCPRCGNSYTYRKNMLRHMNLECGKEPKFQCPFCPKKAKHKAHIIRHIKTQHSANIAHLDLTFNCPDCGKSYWYKKTMSRHLRLECGKEPQFHCPNCPYRAKQKNHLATDDGDELRNCSLEEKGYEVSLVNNFITYSQCICELCGKHCELWKGLNVYSTDKERKYRCTYKNKKFMILKVPGAFKCPGCGKSYWYKKTMLRHLRLECGKEPQFHCPYCPHRAKQKNHLVKHIASRHKDAVQELTRNTLYSKRRNIIRRKYMKIFWNLLVYPIFYFTLPSHLVLMLNKILMVCISLKYSLFSLSFAAILYSFLIFIFHCPCIAYQFLLLNLLSDVTVDSFPQEENFLPPEFWTANNPQPYKGYNMCDRRNEEIFTCVQCGKSYHHKKNLGHGHGDPFVGQDGFYREDDSCVFISDTSTNSVIGYNISNWSSNENVLSFNNTLCTKSKPTGEGIFSCPQCNKVYTWKANLSRHLRLECDFSSFDFETEYSVSKPGYLDNDWIQDYNDSHLQQFQPQQNMQQIGVTEPTYVCSNCNKVYSNRGNLRRHISIECGKLPCQKCPYCAFVTKYKGTVQEHIRRRHKDLPNINT
ncbi:hypothetical protein L9F63_012177, partial [Diploptera punctata]